MINSEDMKFCLALLIIIITSILVYTKSINVETYTTILTFILGYYFGKNEQQYSKYREVKKFVVGEYEYQKLKKMIKRFSYLLLISGITLILEKYICYGAIITIPPILNHGLYGIILTLFGCILLIKKNGEYWWEKHIKYIPKYKPIK